MSTKPESNPHGDQQMSKLFEQWNRITNKILRSESAPHDFGNGDLLFSSEIHTLCAIGNNPGINITDLSAQLGVTKGAISKMAKRMEEKGLIERHHKPGNDKEILLDLTPKGKKVHLGHREYHAKEFERLSAQIEKLTGKQVRFLFEVFGFIEEMIDSTLPDREGTS